MNREHPPALEPCDPGPITRLLRRLESGDDSAMEALVPLVYSRLHAMARRQRRANPDSCLDTTALVHEAYLRFARRDRNVYRHRGHFFAVAAAAMRQVLIDAARTRSRGKRGGGERPLALEERDVAIDSQAEFLLALDGALERLDRLSPRLRRVVDCRYFCGLTEAETAAALGVDPRTVRRDWAKARAWLTVELDLERGPS